MRNIFSARKFCKVLQALTLYLVSKALREWMLPSVQCMMPYALNLEWEQPGTWTSLWMFVSVCFSCILLLSHQALGSRSCRLLLSSPSGKKKKKHKGILSPCCSGKLYVLVIGHQPCMILGLLIFKMYHSKIYKDLCGKLCGLQSSLLFEIIAFYCLCGSAVDF